MWSLAEGFAGFRKEVANIAFNQAPGRYAFLLTIGMNGMWVNHSSSIKWLTPSMLAAKAGRLTTVISFNSSHPLRNQLAETGCDLNREQKK